MGRRTVVCGIGVALAGTLASIPALLDVEWAGLESIDTRPTVAALIVNGVLVILALIALLSRATWVMLLAILYGSLGIPIVFYGFTFSAMPLGMNACCCQSSACMIHDSDLSMVVDTWCAASPCNTSFKPWLLWAGILMTVTSTVVTTTALSGYRRSRLRTKEVRGPVKGLRRIDSGSLAASPVGSPVASPSSKNNITAEQRRSIKKELKTPLVQPEREPQAPEKITSPGPSTDRASPHHTHDWEEQSNVIRTSQLDWEPQDEVVGGKEYQVDLKSYGAQSSDAQDYQVDLKSYGAQSSDEQEYQVDLKSCGARSEFGKDCRSEATSVSGWQDFTEEELRGWQPPVDEGVSQKQELVSEAAASAVSSYPDESKAGGDEGSLSTSASSASDVSIRSYGTHNEYDEENQEELHVVPAKKERRGSRWRPAGAVKLPGMGGVSFMRHAKKRRDGEE